MNDAKSDRPAGKRYIEEIGLTRVLAILAVILVHATSKVEVSLAADSMLFSFYNYVNVLFKIGTTTFIFLSAFVLFYTYYDRPADKRLFKSFYLKRFKFILIPYTLVSIIYFVVPRYHNGTLFPVDGETIKLFLSLFAEGKVYAHLYFVFVNVQFYLLFPLLLRIFQKRPGWVKHAVWAGFVIQWGFIYLNQEVIGYTNKGSVAFSYMSHYFLGIFAAVYYDRFLAWLKSRWGVVVWIGFLAAGSVHAWMWIMQRKGLVLFHLRLLDLFWCLHTVLAALALLHISFWLYRKLHPALLRWLLNLGACSFGIYLLHPLVLYYYRAWTGTGDPLLYHLALAGAFLSALFVSWLVVYGIARYVPASWVIIGNTPFRSRNR